MFHDCLDEKMGSVICFNFCFIAHLEIYGSVYVIVLFEINFVFSWVIFRVQVYFFSFFGAFFTIFLFLSANKYFYLGFSGFVLTVACIQCKLLIYSHPGIRSLFPLRVRYSVCSDC